MIFYLLSFMGELTQYTPICGWLWVNVGDGPVPSEEENVVQKKKKTRIFFFFFFWVLLFFLLYVY